MFIQSTLEPKTVEDYDFQFDNGLFITVTLDKNGGDTLTVYPEKLVFHIAEKPSLTDPEVITPPEDMTIFMSHVLMQNYRIRKIVMRTPEQEAEFKTLFRTPKFIQ